MLTNNASDKQEVTLNPGVTDHKLRGLRPSSTYTALLQGERGGVYTAAISADFTTGVQPFITPDVMMCTSGKLLVAWPCFSFRYC